jgi:hypothetical protein
MSFYKKILISHTYLHFTSTAKSSGNFHNKKLYMYITLRGLCKKIIEDPSKLQDYEQTHSLMTYQRSISKLSYYFYLMQLWSLYKVWLFKKFDLNYIGQEKIPKLMTTSPFIWNLMRHMLSIFSKTSPVRQGH